LSIAYLAEDGFFRACPIQDCDAHPGKMTEGMSAVPSAQTALIM